MKELTIGMAHANDFHGVFFTVHSLRLNNDLSQCELIIVDNTPDTPHGKAVKDLVGKLSGVMDIKYVPFAIEGTSQTRETVFKEASGKAVLCMDCHVLLRPGAIQKLIQWYKDPTHTDLYTGPLLHDQLNSCSTHFDIMWRSEMWGIWGGASKCKCGKNFCFNEGKFLNMETNQKEIDRVCVCGLDLSSQIPNKLGLDPEAEPFQIPAQGLGLFTCRKDCWLGFNPNSRHFGGEECYIHEKYRQVGKKTMCLPFLGWLHRFTRPDGVPYTINLYSKIKNYIYEFNEIGRDTQEIFDNFKHRIDENKWNELKEECRMVESEQVISAQVAPSTEPVESPTKDSFVTMFEGFKQESHMWINNKLKLVKSVFDFSGTADTIISEIALLSDDTEIKFHQLNPQQNASMGKISLDWRRLKNYEVIPMEVDTQAAVVNANMTMDSLSRVLRACENVPLIIITNIGISDGIAGMLNLWMKGVNRYITDMTHEGNVTIAVSRHDITTTTVDPALKQIMNSDAVGAGTNLKKTLGSFGIETKPGCKCNTRSRVMNIMGVKWCDNNVPLILDWLAEEAKKQKLPFVKMAAKIILKRAIRNAKKAEIQTK